MVVSIVLEADHPFFPQRQDDKITGIVHYDRAVRLRGNDFLGFLTWPSQRLGFLFHSAARYLFFWRQGFDTRRNFILLLASD